MSRLAPSALFALALIALAPAPARADPASDLVDRYVAWRGGAAFERLTSVHEKGRVESSGLEGALEFWMERGGRQRSDADLGVLKNTSVIAGGASWDTTASGQIETSAEADVRYAQRDAALQFADALRGRDGAADRYLGTETRDRRSWGVIRVSFGDEDSYDAFIDPATGELDGFRILENRKGRFEQLADWRVVDGVRVPFLLTTTADIKTENSTIRFSEIALNGRFEGALFARPAPVRRASFKDGASSTSWIPFEFYDENRIFFPAKINGHDTVVLLDSGAETSVIDKTYAAQIGLTAQGAVTAMGAGGTDTAGLINGVNIEIGDLVLDNLSIAAIDIAPIGQRLGHPLPFILGGEVFNELAIDIDFANRRLAFRNPDRLQKPAGAVEVPLEPVQGIRSVPVSVEGGPEVPFDFDLGNGAPLLVMPAYYELHGLLQGRQTSQVLSGAVGGVHPETEATIRRLTFAGADFSDVPTVFPGTSNAGLNSNVAVGNVGLPIIDRFHVIIDFSHDRAWLTPDPDRIKAPFAKDRLGLLLVKSNRDMSIEFVSPGSPAEAVGFKTGEHVVLIDRKPRAAWPREALVALARQSAGTVVEFTLADGTVRRVRLADYF